MSNKAKEEKMKKTMKTSQVIKPLYFYLFAIILEIVNFSWLKFSSAGGIQLFPEYILLDLAVYMIIAGIIFISPKILANIIMYLFIGLQVLVNIVNATLYKVFGDIFSFDMMKLGIEAAAAFKLEFIDLWSVVLNLFLLAIIIFLQVVIDRRFKKEISFSKITKKGFKALAFSLSLIVGVSGFYLQTKGFTDSDESVEVYASDQYLWDNQHFKLEAYKKFGTYGFYVKNLANLIYKNDKLNTSQISEIKAMLDEGKKDVNTNAELYGDNLIVIMLESFEWYAIDPFNTPTLWDLRTNSAISFENFYGKNKTNVSEDIGILGNMPKDTGMDKLAANGYLDTPYTLPNLFKEQGYTANYFHSYIKTFYNRNVVNKAMGFENVYGLEDADLENKTMSFNNWNLDSDYINSLIDLFIPTDKPFMSFFTTVATHGSYDMTNKKFAPYYEIYDANLEQYKSWLEENTDYVYPVNHDTQRYLRQYKCAAMDADRMVANIIKNLEEKGLDDKTSILLYADHNCYYEDLCFDIKNTQKDDYMNIYNYNIPCMLYSPKLGHAVNTDFVNTYDIFPTICELYGLPYNTAMTQGYNMLSSDIENSIMISYLTGIFNDKFYSQNIVDSNKIAEATDEDLVKYVDCSSNFYKKQHTIELIYKYGLVV